MLTNLGHLKNRLRRLVIVSIAFIIVKSSIVSLAKTPPEYSIHE